MSEAHAKEISIPVPWGHIAGKVWGANSDSERLLAVHGRQDNCAVYDRLMPLLHGNYLVVAIDLPGHGFSSHFPPGLPVHFFDYIVALCKVIQHLKWDKFCYLGHSLGGQFGVFLSILMPVAVKKMIIMDHVGPLCVEENLVSMNLQQHFQNYFKLTSKLESGSHPVYTLDEMLRKLMKRDSFLTKDAARLVLNRSAKKLPSGYVFAMDQRIKINEMPIMTQNILKNIYENIVCPCLMIFSTERFYLYTSEYSEVMKLVREKPNFTVQVVEGNHDFHQNYPERVVDFIDQFFLPLNKL